MRFVRLNIINNAFEHDNITTISGDNLFALVQSVYPKGLPLNTSLYHGAWDSECDITPKSVQDIDAINTLDGEFWLVTYPAAAIPMWAVIALSVTASIAVAFLMPKPEIPNTSSSQPPSPNNALASRGNRQRLGGRVPDIFGEIWAFPDLIAPTYSVYINHQEVEYAYMALGVGEYEVKKAYDDTTPIGFINGATASVFNPNKSFLDAPDVRFGSHLSSDETTYNALFVKRYGAINGQILTPPDKYVTLASDATFRHPNLIIAGSNQNLSTQFKVGDKLLVELANQLQSIKSATNDAGRNLLLRTGDWGYNWGVFGNNGNVTHSISGNVITIGSNEDSWKHVASLHQSARLQSILQVGQTYTLSVWARATQGTQNVLITVRDSIKSGGFNNNIVTTQVVDSNWRRVIVTGVYQHTPDRNLTQIFFEQAGGIGSVQFKEPKLELGAIATAYSHAPEDSGYNLNGIYTIQSIDNNIITLQNPSQIASDWELLSNRGDAARANGVVISTEETTLWQGWFYTDLADHDDLIINIKAPNGIYTSYGDEWSALRVYFEIQSELINDDGVVVPNTRRTRTSYIQSPSYDKYLDSQGRAWVRTTDDDVRRTAAVSVRLSNPLFTRGKRIRWRIRRTTRNIHSNKGQVLQDIKIVDCFGVRYMTEQDTPPNVTLVSTKTLATEGALSLKERKLRLLVQRKLRDYRNADSLILSNRIDDIIYNIATDPLNGAMQANELNMAQISAEINAQIAYFGTDKCSEFGGTFDNTDVTTEEMIQTVAQAGFCQAYRLNNQIHLHFERKQDYAVVQFNSHNILPDSYSYSESFGARNDHDGVQVTYTDPIDDAKVTLDYPANKSAQKPQKIDLLGVRNKVQAHMHLMRTHHKNQYAYKSCEFTGADESGIVIPTNRIDVASQLQADVMQGVVESLETANGQIIARLSEPCRITSGTLFVQTTAGVVDNIAISQGDDKYSVVLSRMPSQPLSLSPSAVVRATYKIVAHTETDRDAYIVSGKSAGENPLSHKLTCVNYTDKYYQNDSDFKKGLISL